MMPRITAGGMRRGMSTKVPGDHEGTVAATESHGEAREAAEVDMDNTAPSSSQAADVLDCWLQETINQKSKKELEVGGLG